MLHSEHNGITVREARETDLAQYRDLRLEALKLAPTAFGSDYQESLALPGSAWLERLRGALSNHRRALFVADNAGVLVGMTGVQREPGIKRQHNASITSVYLRPSVRGRGLGAQLMAHAMLWAQQMGVKRLELRVNTQNSAAIALYTRSGFEIVGTLHGTLRVGDQVCDEYILERAL
jgi:ribosomal protein S18 acetylase RimI-like enzyme